MKPAATTIDLILDQYRAGELLNDRGDKERARRHFLRATRLLRYVLYKTQVKGMSIDSSNPTLRTAARALIVYPELSDSTDALLDAITHDNLRSRDRALAKVKAVVFYMTQTAEQPTGRREATLFQELSALCLAIALGAVLLFFTGVVSNAISPQKLPEIKPQLHYKAFANNGGDAALWLEFGKRNRLISGLPNDNNLFSVSLGGFKISNAWRSISRHFVTWSVEAQETGTIRVAFPAAAGKNDPERIDRLALFLTDPHSNLKAVRIRSGETDKFAGSLRQGRWVSIPVSEEDSLRGEKILTLTSVFDEPITVSALVLLRKERIGG